VVDAGQKVDEWRIPKCPEGQQSELHEEPEIRRSAGTRNSQIVDYVQKASKHEKEPELPRHRKFDSSGRYPGSPTSGRRRARRVEDRCEIGTDICYEGSKTESREPEVAVASAVKAMSRRDQEPKSLKLSLRGSVETQAQHRLDRLGEPWDRLV
jgi:hypothetical protein